MYWFALEQVSEGGAPIIISADDRDDAVKKFGVLMKGRRVIQMTWVDVSKFLGCVIPPQFNVKDWAKGCLMIHRGGNFCYLWAGCDKGD